LKLEATIFENRNTAVYTAYATAAFLKKYGDLVAVKVFKRALDPSEVDMFNQEISLLEYFKDHSNIVKVLGFGSVPNHFLVMKYYPLGSLTRWIREYKKKRKAIVLAFLWDISEGLTFMHSKGVIHNDIKPDNVLLDEMDGSIRCVLTDLGISRVITDDILRVKEFHVTQTKALSFAYSSPEKILNVTKGRSIGSKEAILSWDVYSFAILLYQMLNKRLYSIDKK
jgi:serine/threonine protein kinase